MRLMGLVGFCVAFVKFLGCEGRKPDSAHLLHVVHVASVKALFVQPEKNIEVRRHRAHLRVKVTFNPFRLKFALRFLLI